MYLSPPSCRTLSILNEGCKLPVHLSRMFVFVVPTCQVYKENLVETILPSIQSVMTAVLHYKKMGGEANLYINDDGLQVIVVFETLGDLPRASAACLSGESSRMHEIIRCLEL